MIIISIVNVKRMFFALLTADEVGDVLTNLIFETPEYIPGIRQIDAKNKTNSDKLYAEGVIWAQETTVEETTIDIDIADLANSAYAKYLGHKMATEGGSYTTTDDKAPYLAILFEAEKGNGAMAYRVYYKGKLTEPDEGAKTKEGKTDYQTHKAQATFQSLKNNGMGVYKVDSDDADCPAGIADTFFTEVFIPTLKVGV